ncbi:hypothetical protein HPB47_013451 [Ixodes persulcatus]|uniref:Uncharacterized protein n=1 Tax=Ixodes persulcatus TaxID=34615 RepID=A0AC60R2Y4_IXOPE|nr:hypothetical protein HPB47_013451 [Ixodes persulcatus]
MTPRGGALVRRLLLRVASREGLEHKHRKTMLVARKHKQTTLVEGVTPQQPPPKLRTTRAQLTSTAGDRRDGEKTGTPFRVAPAQSLNPSLPVGLVPRPEPQFGGPGPYRKCVLGAILVGLVMLVALLVALGLMWGGVLNKHRSTAQRLKAAELQSGNTTGANGTDSDLKGNGPSG